MTGKKKYAKLHRKLAKYEESGKCKRPLDVNMGGVKYKVVDPKDPCASIHRVLARREGSKVISPETYEVLKKESEHI